MDSVFFQGYEKAKKSNGCIKMQKESLYLEVEVTPHQWRLGNLARDGNRHKDQRVGSTANTVGIDYSLLDYSLLDDNLFKKTSSRGGGPRKQVKYLSKYFTINFLWSFFKWFFSGTVDACGFDNFPSLGIKAYINTLTYVGTGMICPHVVNCSILFGAVISWGLMWPLIQNMQGKWYDASYTGDNFIGLFGYKVFLSIALILGDGLYHFVRVTLISLHGMFINYRTRHSLPTRDEGAGKDDVLRNYDEQRRNNI